MKPDDLFVVSRLSGYSSLRQKLFQVILGSYDK